MGGKPKGTRTTETDLSRASAKILKSRESTLFQGFFFPQLRAAYGEVSGPQADARLADLFVGTTQQGRVSDQDRIKQSFAQRGVTGGFEATGLASLELAQAQEQRSLSLKAQQENQRMQAALLSQAAQLSPQPFQGAGYGTKTG